MAKSPAHSAAHLRHVFHGEPHGDLDAADALHISLHSADPSAATTQDASEVSYDGYSRARVSRNARNGGGFAVNDGIASNKALVTFPPAKSDATITHFGIGTAASGKGSLLYSGQLHEPLKVHAGIAPAFPAGAIQIRED